MLAPQQVWQEASLLVSLRDRFILPVRNADLVVGAAYIVTEVAEFGTADDRLEGVGALFGRDSLDTSRFARAG